VYGNNDSSLKGNRKLTLYPYEHCVISILFPLTHDRYSRNNVKRIAEEWVKGINIRE